jgi:hypothetical protein
MSSIFRFVKQSSFNIISRNNGFKNTIRNFSDKNGLFHQQKIRQEIPNSTKIRNGATAFALLGGVGFIYSTSMNKMKNSDELATLLDGESLKNSERKE